MRNAVASYAVRGNADGLIVYSKCSVTTESRSPWWTVDLGNMYRVDDVVVVLWGTNIGRFMTLPTYFLLIN